MGVCDALRTPRPLGPLLEQPAASWPASSSPVGHDHERAGATDAGAGLLGGNLSNADIASRQHIAEKTVDHHVSAILAKLGVRSRREVAASAEGLGIPVARDDGAKDGELGEPR